MRILSLVAINVTFVRIFLYVTLSSNVKLQVEYIIPKVNSLVIVLMLFILSLVPTVVTNMLGLH